MTRQFPGIILYIAEEDLFRLGNATSPRLDKVRDADVDFFMRNGIKFVRANGRGISLLTEESAKRKSGNWLWKLAAGTHLPSGLILNHDRADHYSLCPAADMSLDGFKGILAELASTCERVGRV